MSSLSSSQERSLNAMGRVIQVGTDAPVAIRLRYVGGGSVTSVTVTTATNIVTVSVEAGVTHTDTYAFGTYTTVGALVDKINSNGRFEARVLDTLRSYATASQFVDGAISASSLDGISIWDVKVDTSAAKYFAVCLAPDISRGFFGLGRGHRVHLQEAKYYATLGAAGAAGFIIVERSYTPAPSIFGGAATETTIYSATSVSASATTINWASGNGKITSKAQSELVAVLVDSTTLADAAANYLYVAGIIE